jgi:plasmid stability protein
MATITLKNIPAELHRELKKRAEEHHRSLNREILATLKNATSGTIRLDPAKLEESVRRARSLFRHPPITAREIDQWKREGRL